MRNKFKPRYRELYEEKYLNIKRYYRRLSQINGEILNACG